MASMNGTVLRYWSGVTCPLRIDDSGQGSRTRHASANSVNCNGQALQEQPHTLVVPSTQIARSFVYFPAPAAAQVYSGHTMACTAQINVEMHQSHSAPASMVASVAASRSCVNFASSSLPSSFALHADSHNRRVRQGVQGQTLESRSSILTRQQQQQEP